MSTLCVVPSHVTLSVECNVSTNFMSPKLREGKHVFGADPVCVDSVVCKMS